MCCLYHTSILPKSLLDKKENNFVADFSSCARESGEEDHSDWKHQKRI